MKGLEPSTFCMAKRSRDADWLWNAESGAAETQSESQNHDTLVRSLVRSERLGRSSSACPTWMYGGSPDAPARPARDRVPARRDREGRASRCGPSSGAARTGRGVRVGSAPAPGSSATAAGAGARARAGRPRPADGVPGTPAGRRVHRSRGGRARRRARARAADDAAREAAAGGPTFRALAHAWLEHLELVQSAKPSTLRDYRSMLAEPGTPYRRGRGKTVGRIMAALGDRPAAEITTAHIEALLLAHAREGVGARSINKHRQVLSAIFNFGLRPEQAARWRLTGNPAAAAAKRREDPPRRLEVFTVEQIEALARTAAAGAWRGPHEYTTADGELLRAEEDAQLGELLRVAAYTGLRMGELVALRWHDVRWSERVLVVERALSGDIEGTTKGRRIRYVPLGDQALGALDRLSRRAELHERRRLRLRRRGGRPARPVGAPPPLRRGARRGRPAATAIPRPPPHRRNAAHARARPGDGPRRPRPRRPQDDRALPPRRARVAAGRRRHAGVHARGAARPQRRGPGRSASRGRAARARARRAGSSRASDSRGRDDRLPIHEGRELLAVLTRSRSVRDRPPARLPPTTQGCRPPPAHLRIPRRCQRSRPGWCARCSAATSACPRTKPSSYSEQTVTVRSSRPPRAVRDGGPSRPTSTAGRSPARATRRSGGSQRTASRSRWRAPPRSAARLRRGAIRRR